MASGRRIGVDGEVDALGVGGFEGGAVLGRGHLPGDEAGVGEAGTDGEAGRVEVAVVAQDGAAVLELAQQQANGAQGCRWRR